MQKKPNIISDTANINLKNYSSIKELLLESVKILEHSGIDDAKQNVNLITAKALGISYTHLPFYWSKPISSSFWKKFIPMLERRLLHEPLQYILGKWCFLDLDVNVGSGVLIPRPETEEVFLAAAEYIKASSLPYNFVFADIGTGTGILGIAMAKYFPASTGTLVDISDEALKIAKRNLMKYSELNKRIKLKKSDLLEGFPENSLDVIISNPPYIDSDEIQNLMPEVLNYEPHLALDGGKDGLCLINELQLQASKVLKNKGIFVFEHGHGQRDKIKNLLLPCWTIIKEGNDFADKERYFVLKLEKGKTDYEKDKDS